MNISYQKEDRSPVLGTVFIHTFFHLISGN